MTRPPKRHKVAEDSTSDNVAPSELLDSLQAACVKIEEQRRHLSYACYAIQHPHSRLLDDDSLDVEKAYQRSVDSAIKAWRSATAAYSTLFATLLNPSDAQPYTSWSEKRRDELEELSKSSLLAKTSAYESQLHEERVETGAGDTKSNNGDAKPTNTSNPALKRDYSSLDENAESESIPASTATDYVVPKVEYEDISAQVDARLQAKKAKQEAAKKEKKRKRESGESFLESESIGKVDKPVKKKAKGEAEAGVATPVINNDKRKSHEHPDEEGEGDANRKKRKKVEAEL